tara:strand:- start:112857 stop:114116 length:1260 start_codon:yes stop_codon:yes gene_type:complete
VTSYLRFIGHHWALLGFGFITVFWGNFGQSFFFAWFGADIQRSLGMTAGTYGSAYSLATLASAITIVWAGGLIDKMSLRRFSMLISLGLAVAMLVMSQASGLLTLLLGFFLMRLFGQSLLPHTGMTTMSRYFDDGRGKAISVAMSGVPVGEIILPVMAVMMIAWVGWQFTFMLLAAAVVVVLLPTLLWLLSVSGLTIGRQSTEAPSEDENPTTRTRDGGRTEVLTDYRFWLALPGLLANPFMITGVFIHQNFLLDSKGWDMSWLATCFIVYGAVHWLSSLISGVVVDRVRSTILLLFPLLPLLASLLVAAFMPGAMSALLMMALLGMSAGSSPPVTGWLWPQIYGTRKLGSIRSMNMAVMVLGTSISPVLFGYFIDTGITEAGLFGACAVYIAVAMLLMMFSYPSNSAPRKKLLNEGEL